MGLFSQSQIDEINAVAAKSQEVLKPVKVSKSLSSFQSEIQKSSAAVLDYFKDSPAILITTKQQLHEYVLKAIEAGYCGIDTETTGLDRIQDTIVGASLYYPGGVECYIPCKHLVPVFDTLYKDQLTYEEVGEELQLFVEAKTKMIFANADFDLAFIYKDFNVDMIDICYYDVILAWRCLKEDEKNNALKPLYTKYVLKGKADPKKFSDFFSPKTFPYSKPDVAKLYAANDAKITYELFVWQLPYVTKSNPKCQKNKLEKIADLVWNIEIPMIRVCALMHRYGIFLDLDTSNSLQTRYHKLLDEESAKLADMVQEIISNSDTLTITKSPFKTGKDFNQSSPPQVKYLLNSFMGLQVESSDKNVLKELNLPVTKQILKVRSITTLLGSFVDKLPGTTGKDGRVHSTFKSIGADTGRMCIAKGTKITCLNGYKNIEDIVPGDLVYCYDNNGIVQLKPVKNLWLTGTNRECVRIKWQSSGKGDIGELICTPEHLILKKTGEWVRADSLKRYDKLAHLRRSNQERPALNGWNGFSSREQDVVKYTIFKADSKMIVHHKDGNPSNNELSNLEIMNPSNHARLHTKQMQAEGRVSYKSFHTEEALARRAEVMKRNSNARKQAFINDCIAHREDYLETIKQCGGHLTKAPEGYEKFKLKCEAAGIDVDKECAKYNTKYVSRTISEEQFMESYYRNNGYYKAVAKDLGLTKAGFYTLKYKYGASMNHMVQIVEPAGQYDVYDIEVEGIHNFIANEICVHNSSENPNVQNIPSHALDVRHQFRATPAMEKLDKCDVSENNISINLFDYDTIDLEDKVDVKVKDLRVGDKVRLLKDKSEILAEITSLANDAPYTLITMREVM